MRLKIQRLSVKFSMLFICTVYSSFILCLFLQKVVGDESTNDLPSINTNIEPNSSDQIETPQSRHRITRYLSRSEYERMVAEYHGLNGLSPYQKKIISDAFYKKSFAENIPDSREELSNMAEEAAENYPGFRNKSQGDGLAAGVAGLFLLVIGVSIRCCCRLCRRHLIPKTEENASLV